MVKVAGKHDAYLATPPAGKAHKDAGILFIPDVIGIWTNSQLMADQVAANGYTCLIIDVFNGDALELNRPDGFDFPSWLTQGRNGKGPHTYKEVDPIVENALTYMKQELGCGKIGSMGYCFGAKVSRSWRGQMIYQSLPSRAMGVYTVADPTFSDASMFCATTRMASTSATSHTPLSSRRTS